jgi:hypothetical protein
MRRPWPEQAALLAAQKTPTTRNRHPISGSPVWLKDSNDWAFHGSARVGKFGARLAFFRRFRLAVRYVTPIDIMIGSISRSGLAFMVHKRPDLLDDDALRAVDMMFDNARTDGNDLRADQLAVIRKFLADARVRGVENALAAIPESGPLGFQDPDAG